MQSESNRGDAKSYKVEGTRYDVILCQMGVVGKKISKNNLGEVEIASEESDMTNSP